MIHVIDFFLKQITKKIKSVYIAIKYNDGRKDLNMTLLLWPYDTDSSIFFYELTHLKGTGYTRQIVTRFLQGRQLL